MILLIVFKFEIGLSLEGSDSLRPFRLTSGVICAVLNADAKIYRQQSGKLFQHELFTSHHWDQEQHTGNTHQCLANNSTADFYAR